LKKKNPRKEKNSRKRERMTRCHYRGQSMSENERGLGIEKLG